MAPKSGTSPPAEAALETLHKGETHLSESLLMTFVQNVYGALLISSGSLLSQILSGGFPNITSQNEGLARLLQGMTFPLGLVAVYLVGAELYTGYPMWYTITALSRRGTPRQHIFGAATSWLGNLLGTIIAAGLLTYATGALSEEPFRSHVVNHVQDTIIDMEWHVIMLRAMGCGWLVTVAMFLGTQSKDSLGKAFGLWFPFFISAASDFPHTVENMYVVQIGMYLGAPLSVGGFLWKAMLPITLGNTIGGSLGTGLYLWWTYRPDVEDEKQKKEQEARTNGMQGYADDGGA